MVRTKKQESDFGNERLLTETELQLMAILWELGEGTVADVMAQLNSERQLAYTSVSTILRILEKKGILGIRREGRGHVYIPKIQKAQYKKVALRDLVEKVFSGSRFDLVKQLLQTDEIDPEELNQLRSILNAKKSGPA